MSGHRRAPAAGTGPGTARPQTWQSLWTRGYLPLSRRQTVSAVVGLLALSGILTHLFGISGPGAPLVVVPVFLAAAELGVVRGASTALAGAVLGGPVLAGTGLDVRHALPVGWVVEAVLLQALSLVVVQMTQGLRRAERRTVDLLAERQQVEQSVHAERQVLGEQLRHRSTHDILTDLPNRSTFLEQVERALASATDGTTCAVLLIDLDDFKTVNDSLGHATGDELLVAVAGRLQNGLRSASRDGDMLARLGGDEFALLINHLAADDAASVVDRLLTVLRAPFALPGGAVTVRVSAGLVIAGPGAGLPPHAQALELLRQADLAMYHVKSSGRGGVAVFHEQMQQTMLDRLTLEAELQRAVDEGQMLCVYQPLLDLSTGLVNGTEALVRWRHPERGLVPPDAFIPAAERSGAIVAIGIWVLEEACRQLRRWDHQLSGRQLHMAVNMSARQLEHPGIVEAVADVLFRSGVDPRRIVLEITESLLMEDSDTAIATLWRLRGLGVRLALDDFGTGYSSLSRLGSLPIDEMKIDRSFVSALGATDTGGPIIAAAVAMAHGLGLSVVAEGVETEEQLVFLRSVGCELGQGYLIGRPGLPDDVLPLLADRFDLPDNVSTIPRQRQLRDDPQIPSVLPSLVTPSRHRTHHSASSTVVRLQPPAG